MEGSEPDALSVTKLTGLYGYYEESEDTEARARIDKRALMCEFT